MGKKLLRGFLALLAALLLSAVLYLGPACYYRNRFVSGTWINGIYCTGMDIGQAEQKLREIHEPFELSLYDEAGRAYQITQEEMGYVRDYAQPLTEILKGQSAAKWLLACLYPENYEIEPAIYFDETALQRFAEELPCTERSLPTKRGADARIVRNRQGVYELEEDGRNIVDAGKLSDKLAQAVAAGEREVWLMELDVYKDLNPSRETREVYDLFKKINRIQETEITHVIDGEEVMPEPAVLAGFIMTDESGAVVLGSDGAVILDEKKIKEYVKGLADEYDTVGITRTFHKTSGGTVAIEGGTYGFQIDQKAEAEALAREVSEGGSVRRKPFYEKTPFGRERGADEIGNTFIEIDMTEQVLYYYVNGNLFTQTPVVTGDMAKKRSTPARVCYVYAKQKGRTLRGPGYASYVNYWMPVNGNIGLHDATWRKKFGGDIYKTSGSHGCINLPKEQAEKIFKTVEVGTPVIMYY